MNSLIGNRDAIKKNPLQYFRECLKAVKTSRPKAFVLENVRALQSSNGGKVYGKLLRELRSACARRYFLSLHVLNTKDYGVPQNRERLYIVGLSRSVAKGPLSTPPSVPLKMRFEDIVEKKTKRRAIGPELRAKLDACARNYAHPVFMSPNLTHMKCSASAGPVCLTRRGGGIYWSKKKILSTVREELRLQGFPDFFRFPPSVSENVARQLVGNSMSVNVLRAIFREIFKRCKYFKKRASS